MRAFDNLDHDDAGVVFRDMITLMLCGFVVCVVLMLPHVNPARRRAPPRACEPRQRRDRGAPGRPSSTPTSTSGSRVPATCRSATPTRAASLFNLLRDDLGRRRRRLRAELRGGLFARRRCR